jgi:penicillin-insensitive murein DD-endopeptidase
MRLRAILGVLALAACVPAIPPALSQDLANQLFGAHRLATDEPAEVYGSYARGCGDGFVQLPETGPTWQAMRLSRNRNWGHPELIGYLQDLSRQAVEIGWNGLYIGDLSQPRGGPMTSGHASHQLGLDADIWMLPPGRLNLSITERENISSVSVRTADQRGLTEHWTPRHAQILRAAASDPRVDRIFVTAAVKIELCRTATPEDTPWLQRIRPIQGHNYHFHVRLRCPAGSRDCETQTPTVAELSNGGNGCDDTLMWWVTDFLNPPPPDPNAPPAPRRRHPREYTLADLPRQCTEVVQRP